MGKIREYSNGETTVVWEAEKCIHSAICAKGLPEVFQPRERPWVKIDAANTTTIINQVKQCPSGALRYYMNAEGDNTAETLKTKVEVLENGPLLVYGTLKVTDKHGNVETKNKTTAFCRCGSSNNKPYCDGTHIKAEFKG
ncbi:(4Fe-4S)-binding protein [Ichthyenterobacterium magnum]|uniref:CDGSH-type Zn-finger protein n=1 Tax=Ichthyenterobacterium magnum TaxID=1230530 RepID=A0A420DVN3_9FLAO|nr:(4Fe-4S)-binding protein [Ichthyenterobacterium magnum]RKE98284.1 CDGSH-type Zn-finger protein [Ichthyenterobacterium magnum]